MNSRLLVPTYCAPVAGRDRALRLPVDGDERVVPVLREVADARGERAAELLAVALVRRAARGGRGDAGVLLAQDDVDHPRDRIGPVDRRRAVLQDLDALDRVERHLVQVDERPLAVVGQAVDGEPAAVDQHERVVRAEAAQRHAGRPGAEPVDERVGDRAVVVRGDRLHDRGDRLQARCLDVLARDRLDRRRRLGVHALDVGAGHVDLDVLRQRRRRQQQCGRREREGRQVLLHRDSLVARCCGQPGSCGTAALGSDPDPPGRRRPAVASAGRIRLRPRREALRRRHEKIRRVAPPD